MTIINFADEAIKQLAKECHETAKSKGWWSTSRDTIEAKLLLVHSEISEAAEALRNGDPDDEKCPGFGNFEIELADAIIRIFDITEKLQLDIAGALAAKMAYNSTRPDRHGGKTF